MTTDEIIEVISVEYQAPIGLYFDGEEFTATCLDCTATGQTAPKAIAELYQQMVREDQEDDEDGEDAW